jgi:phospholipase C
MSLTQIDHIVVLMLENRSFDHMLGYLSHPSEGRLRADVDGLKGNESNVYTNNQGDQITVKSEHMASPIMNGDPCHEWGCVEEQLSNNNGGFVKNYFRKVSKPETIMHYFNAADVPVFDHLAREFTICDRWFASLPGPTQPNRAYSLAGTSDSRKENFNTTELLLGHGFMGKTIFEMLPANVSWKIYTHDIAALRFFKKFRTALVKEIDKVTEFFKDAAAGTLPDVSWIDPDFGIAVFPGPPNDDHPQHDSRHCQNFVSNIYNALLASPSWSKTLFIVTYDEHGGFYDHVSPRTFTPADADQQFAKYGVRVPAFVISPWAAREICYGSDSHGLSSNSVIFDHTSILRTILKRFATPTGASVPSMTPRVDAANDLDQLLTEQQPRTDCTAAPVISNVPVALKDRFLLETDQSDLQRELQAMVVQATADGVPASKL